MSDTIGFIGLGNMGLPMAENLAAAGYALRVFNRNPAKASSLIARGVERATQPVEVATPGGVVITMLSNDAAVEAVAGEQSELIRRLGPNGIHLSMSTIAPATARRLAEQHRARGVSYVAAPVFGRPEAAAARKLWICVSGDPSARERVRPILDTLGQRVFDFGDKTGAANVVKLCGNFMIASAMETMAEAFALAQKNGIEPAALADLFGQTLFACPIYQGYGKIIAEERYRPAGFQLALGFKDVDLVLKTARESRVPMPLGSLLEHRLLAGLAKGRESMDWSALSMGAFEDAGLK